MKWKCSWIQVLWIMAVSLVCLFAFVSGRISYQQFLANEITEISRTELLKPQDGAAVDKGSYTISEDMAVFRYRLPVVGEYKFLEVELKDLSVEELPVLYYGEYKGKQQDEQNFVLRNGKNYLYLGEKKINRIVLAIGGGEGTSFTIEKIKLDENVPRISAKKGALLYVLIFVAVFVLFHGAKSLLGGVVENIWIKPEGSVMQAYSNIMESILLPWQRVVPLSERSKINLRRGIFGMLILYMLVISETDRLTKDFYPKHVLLISILLLVQCFLYYEGKGRPVIWNRKVWGSFLSLALWICIANGIAYKSLYSGVGWFMLLVVLLFGFCVASMEQPDMALKDISCAMAASCVPVFLCSALFCPWQKGAAYTGVFSEPEHFAEYLILLLMVFQFLYAEAEGDRKKKIIFGIGLISSEIFLIGTRKWVYVLFSIGCLLCWKKLQFIRDNIWKRRILFCLGAAGVLAAGGLCLAGKVSAFREMDVYRNLSLRILQRCQVWQAYLRKINLFGHDFVLSLAGKKTHPNNTWISVAYKYGICGLVLYLFLTVRCLCTGFSRWKKKKNSTEYLLLELQAAGVVLGCYSGIEMPFVPFLWVMFYLGIGYYLTKQE